MTTNSLPSPPSSVKEGSSHEEVVPHTLSRDDAHSNRKDDGKISPSPSAFEPTNGYPSNWSGKRTWFRTTFTQMTILGICSFLAPVSAKSGSQYRSVEAYPLFTLDPFQGLWGAMNSLGAGGQSSPGVSRVLSREPRLPA